MSCSVGLFFGWVDGILRIYKGDKGDKDVFVRDVVWTVKSGIDLSSTEHWGCLFPQPSSLLPPPKPLPNPPLTTKHKIYTHPSHLLATLMVSCYPFSLDEFAFLPW